MRRVLVLFMFAFLTIVSGMVAVSSEVQAKGEGGGPPGPKEIPPYIEGTLILLAGGTGTFVGDCVLPFDTRFFNAQLGFDINDVVASGDTVNPGNNVEGHTLAGLPVPSGCFKDHATSVFVVVKSVKNFASAPDPNTGLRSIVMRVVVARTQ